MEKLKIKQITPDKNQPRKYFQLEKMATLKDSIKRHGIISPLIVQKDKDGYLLIDGERRFRAANELGLAEVPVQIVDAKDEFTRMVEQFHIQEQHEAWAPTEKAMAILNIAEISKKPLEEVGKLLSIEKRMIRYYLAFAKLQNKDKFVEYQCSLHNAEKILELKNFARNIKERVLDESFTKLDESKLEKAVIEKIRNNEMASKSAYTRIKDSFRSNPKLIDQFLKGNFDVDKNFVESKALGAYYVRNMMLNLNYTVNNANGFLKEKNVPLRGDEVAILKRGVKVLKDVLELVE